MDEDYDEVIETAILLEEKAYDYYKDNCQKYDHPKMRKFFTDLAIEELRHKRLLENFKDTGDFETAKEKAYKEDIMNQIYNESTPAINIDMEKLTEIFEDAIRLEVEAFQFYKKHLEKFEGKEMIAMIHHLMDLEKNHAKLLREKLDGMRYV